MGANEYGGKSKSARRYAQPVRIGSVQPDRGQPGGFDGQPEAIDLQRCVGAEAHRKPVVVLAYDFDLVGKRKGSANGRVESGLLATEGAHVLIEIVVGTSNGLVIHSTPLAGMALITARPDKVTRPATAFKQAASRA